MDTQVTLLLVHQTQNLSFFKSSSLEQLNNSEEVFIFIGDVPKLRA